MIVEDEVVLRTVGLRKSFGHVRALQSGDLEVRAGQIVGLLGDNGAGKSTFVKTVGGVFPPDGGEVWVGGKRVLFRSPADARAAGLEVVHQDLGVAPDLSVWANMFLGRPAKVGGPFGRLGWLDKRYMRRETTNQLRRLNISLGSVNKNVSELSGGQRQAIAVARGVAWGKNIVLLDEPTNNLGVPEQLEVLELMTQLARAGLGVLVISHNLAQVFEVAQEVVVFRNGRTVATARTADTNQREVVGWMTGVGM